MMDSETRRFLQEEIRRQVNIVLHGETDATDTTLFTEDIANLFPGQSTITGRPVVHPFGIMSRAPKGTISVVVRVGDHAGNRMVTGHRDKGRPTDLEEGESCLYAAQGSKINVRQKKIEIGSSSASEPLVLGNILKTYLTSFEGDTESLANQLTQLVTLLTTFSSSTSASPDPVLAAASVILNAALPAITAAIASIVADLQSSKTTYISTASSNIVSQEAFTERGGS
jgi:hypothetical protein